MEKCELLTELYRRRNKQREIGIRCAGFLGNPRLIAKTIIDTCQIEQQTAGGDGFGGYTYGEDGGVYRDETEQPYGKPPKLLRFSGWIVLAVVVLFILLILNIIFFLPGIFWWLLLAWMVYRWFRRRA